MVNIVNRLDISNPYMSSYCFIKINSESLQVV